MGFSLPACCVPAGTKIAKVKMQEHRMRAVIASTFREVGRAFQPDTRQPGKADLLVTLLNFGGESNRGFGGLRRLTRRGWGAPPRARPRAPKRRCRHLPLTVRNTA